MKDIFTKFHSLKMIIAVIIIASPITLSSIPITPTSIINQYDENPAEIDSALNKAFEESSSMNSKALATALQGVIYSICSWPELFQLKTFIKNNDQLITKMPYVGLATLYEFTEQIKNQINQHKATMSLETSSNLTKACKIIQMAILKVIEKIKNIGHYSANLLSVTSHTTPAATITIQDLLNKTCYDQLQDGLTMFVNSQIAALAIEMPQNLKAVILSEENITNLVNQSLSKTLLATLTPNEIQSLKDFMSSAPVATILNKSSKIINLIKISPITSHWKSLALASQLTANRG